MDEYYESVDSDGREGLGWFDDRLGDFHTTVDLNTMATYHAEPRPYDRTPAAVPAQHPLRAIARVLHEAAIGSIVRICCFSLTDPFAIDMITHHGNDKTMNVILHPEDYTVQQIKKLLTRHSRFFSHRVFLSQVNIRVVADTDKAPCSRYSQLQEKQVLTTTHAVYGSYNLSCAARCANWESIRVFCSPPEASSISHFDRLWNSLEGRELETLYPDIYPSGFRTDSPKRARHA
jgi:hypothetical protein